MTLKVFIFIITLAINTSLLNAGSINLKLNTIAQIITKNNKSLAAYALCSICTTACTALISKSPLCSTITKALLGIEIGSFNLMLLTCAYKLLPYHLKWPAFTVMPMFWFLYPRISGMPDTQIDEYNKRTEIPMSASRKIAYGSVITTLLCIIPQICGIAAAYTLNKLSAAIGD